LAVPVSGRRPFARARATSIVLAILLLGSAVPGVTAQPGKLGSIAPVAAPVPPPTPRALKPKSDTGFQLPFAAGLKVRISQSWHDPYSHNGTSAFAYDFAVPEGTRVLAAASGVVTFTRTGQHKCGGKKLRFKANYVTIAHPDGSATHYGHLSKVEVKVGQVVAAGEEIGRSGKTGFTGCQPHLHFARQWQGKGVAKSVPVFFEGAPKRTLREGETVTAGAAPCTTRKAKSLPVEGFCATYTTLDGMPLFSRLEPAVDFDWSAQGPGGYWLDKPVDGFGATWSGTFEFASAGGYTFDAATSDRVRVSIDGVVVLDDWGEFAGLHAASASVEVAAGMHRIDIQAADDTGAGILRVTWTRLPDDPSRWSKSGPLIR
jgi:hypothetical protein